MERPSLSAKSSPVPRPREEARSPSKQACAVLVLIAALLAGCSSSPQQAADTGGTQTTPVNEAAAETAISFLTSAEPELLCSLMTEEYLARAADNVVGDPVNDCEGAAKIGLERNAARLEMPVRVTRVQVGDELAHVQVEIGESVATVRLAQSDGDWRVDYLSTE